MGKQIFVIVMFLIALSSHLSPCFAQDYRDVVYLKNGSVIKGFYKDLYTKDTLRMETLDGSMIVCPMSDVVRIAKERTDVYVIKKENESLTQKREWRPKGYSGFAQLFYSTGVENENLESFGIYTTHGYRFNHHLFLGAGIGLEKYCRTVSNINVQLNSVTIPLYGEVQYYLLKTRISPAILCRGGYSVNGVKGAFVNTGIGCDFCITPRFGAYVHLLYRWQHYDYEAPDVDLIGNPICNYVGNMDYIMFVGGIRF